VRVLCACACVVRWLCGRVCVCVIYAIEVRRFPFPDVPPPATPTRNVHHRGAGGPGVASSGGRGRASSAAACPSFGRQNADILHHGPTPAYAHGREAVCWRGRGVAAGAPRGVVRVPAGGYRLSRPGPAKFAASRISMCAMIYFPALASATLDDVMIGMLAVTRHSASRASFSSSSPAEVIAELLSANTSIS
jgi:hypothetical protein